MDTAMELDNFHSVPEAMDKSSVKQGWYVSYPVSFQVSLTSFLTLEIVLAFGSNLMVLVLYCVQSGLVDSISNVVTMNLHVLDLIICLVCVPLTVTVVLTPLDGDVALLCCFHEACVTFASVATAVNVLVISLDRYDISVRPANRLLTPGRAVLLLAAVWLLSLLVFFTPFVEAEFFRVPLQSPAWQNRSLLCIGTREYRRRPAVYGHLFLQIPCFCLAAAGMLAAYSRILKALDIRVGNHFGRGQKHKSRRRRRRKRKGTGAGAASLGTQYESRRPAPATGGPPPPLGVHASVSVIIALRRAVRRHRDRRQRQRRVFRMSLITVCTFLLCWAPVSVVNVLLLSLGPSDRLIRLRLCGLALAYATTVLHPLLYAFARHKFRQVLKSKVKKRVVSVLQVDPAPSATVIHNSWVETGKAQQAGAAGARSQPLVHVQA
ncbi:G-protein coupled receptor 22-like [Hypanus sabinus]|uniref:G-protein coupled receptor 22-like n=1 Tax=Hypanus sabinus TaxID=79690 RepID=UPI0028C3DC73|nr:G-protein coupled receptor 22-like [Hypanus sabinus]XP_059799846.1 G-protein coupled receptor 22-like [Hypanus sabinus]